MLPGYRLRKHQQVLLLTGLLGSMILMVSLLILQNQSYHIFSANDDIPSDYELNYEYELMLNNEKKKNVKNFQLFEANKAITNFPSQEVYSNSHNSVNAKAEADPLIKQLKTNDNSEQEEYSDNDIIAEDESEDEYDDYEEGNDNPIFKEGDFDSLPQTTLNGKSVFSSQKTLPQEEVDLNYSQDQLESNAVSEDVASSPVLPDSSSGSEHFLTSFPYGKFNGDRRLQGRDDPEPDLQTFPLMSKTTRAYLLYKYKREAAFTKSHKKLRNFHISKPPSMFTLSSYFLKDERMLIGKDNMHIVENGIFWSKDLESLVPKGLSDQNISLFFTNVKNVKVKTVEPPMWNRCGRPKNQFVTLYDGTHLCARYRAPHDYLVQGEIMSFYLAHLLGINNVPAVVLSKADQSMPQWSGTNASMAIKEAGWKPNSTVALIQWIDHLDRDRMPLMILNALHKHQTITINTPELLELPSTKLVQLVQWSDLIVFDYLTGNYDRVASMQDAADKEQSPAILRETIHNLVTSHKTGGLWLIDNESGLLDAYSLLYARFQPQQQGSRFLIFHQMVLNTICLFRRTIVERVAWLHHHGNAHKLLLDTILNNELLFDTLPSVYQNKEFVKHFQERIGEVYNWMKRCQLQ